MSDDPIMSVLVRLEAGQTALHTGLAGLEAEQASLRTELAAGQATLHAGLVRLEAEHASLRTELVAGQASLHAELVGLEADQASLRTQLVRLEAGQASLRTDFFVELGKTRAEIMQKVEGLQDSLNAIRTDHVVAMGSVDAVRLANENTRADMTLLREQVSVMWKQIKRLESRVRDITGDP